MNWLTNFVRPKIKALVGAAPKPVAPDNLWVKCPNCEQMLFHRDLEANQDVCSFCNHHLRIGPQRRLELLFDDATFEKHALPKTVIDPLKFRDRKRYSDRLKETQAQLSEPDALVVASGRMGGKPVVAHHGGGAGTERSHAALYRGADRSHHRRRHRFLRHAG